MASNRTADFKDEAIAVVSAWVDRVCADKKWSRSAWAAEAGISDTTVTRGMAPTSVSTPKLENLHALAVAAGIPSVVDFLREQGGEQLGQHWVPSDETLAELLEAALPALSEGPEKRDALQVAALAIGAGLRSLSRRPHLEGDPSAMEVITGSVADTIAQSGLGKSPIALRKRGRTKDSL